ncbi:hypothetical protein ACO2TQ_40040 [Burkholderia sp. OKR4-1]|uniref:hypothetical protein n=1 Tax=Burkholderia TaxID=32008 RepID=UPI0024C1A1D3|nr:hypothetical protein [Burkholderia contaminans]MDK0999517.1 hypothetical protein [Burkholderia contaminans]
MTDTPNQMAHDKLKLLTEYVLDELYRHQSAASDDGVPVYRYTDADTGRCFEVKQVEASEPFGPFEMSELAPSGEMKQLDNTGNVTSTKLEPLVSESEARVGPNFLLRSLRESGVDITLLITERLPRPGTPRGHLNSLSECAGTIAFLLSRNKRYGHQAG